MPNIKATAIPKSRVYSAILFANSASLACSSSTLWTISLQIGLVIGKMSMSITIPSASVPRSHISECASLPVCRLSLLPAAASL